MDLSHSYTGNVAILSEKMRRETWYNTFWSRFGGFTAINDDNGNRKLVPSGKPIEMLDSFMSEGRDNMLIPFLNELGENIKYGDTVLEGTGDEVSQRWLRAYVNQWRTAVKNKTGRMGMQRAKIMNLDTASLEVLKRRASKYQNQFVYQAFYYGLNAPLYASSTDDGLAVPKRLHPNWYYYDGGVLTAAGTEKSTKTAANLDTAAGATDTKMDTDLLEDLRVKAMELRIPQIISQGGVPYWAMIVHPNQGKSLRSDSTFQSAQREAFSAQMLKSPELNGSIGYYAGFAIFEDIVGIRGWNSANNSLYNDGLFELSTESNYNAIVFGNGAIGKGIAKPMGLTTIDDDHYNLQEVGTYCIDGYQRADFFSDSDESTVFSVGTSEAFLETAYEAENTSSMIVMTS